MLRSLMAKLKFTEALFPQAISATTAATSAATADAGSLCFLMNVGTFAFDGSNYITVAVQESEDNSTWAAAGAGAIDGEEAAGVAKILDAGTDDEQLYAFHYLGEAKYVRLNLVVTGTVAADIGVEIVQGHLEAMPPA